MTKKFFPVLFTIFASAFLYSCNNGVYDSDPGSDDSNIPNPISPGGPGLGQIKVKFGGALRSFGAGFYTHNGTVLQLSGTIGSGATEVKIMTIQLTDYNGAATYNYDASGTALINYSYFDNAVAQLYGLSTGNNLGHLKITITEDANDKIQGTFEGVVYRLLATPSTSDSIVLTEGRFYLPKL